MTNLDIWLKIKGIKPNIPKKFYIEAFREDCQKKWLHCFYCPCCIAANVCIALDTCLCGNKKEFEKYANYEINENVVFCTDCKYFITGKGYYKCAKKERPVVGPGFYCIKKGEKI